LPGTFARLVSFAELIVGFPAEGRMLRKVLTRLRGNGAVPASEIRVTSPYRNVAEEARKIHEEIFPGVSGDDREAFAGACGTSRGPLVPG
jgi:hypothetical protein